MSKNSKHKKKQKQKQKKSKNSPAVKKVCSPQKAIVKKDVKSKVATKNDCDGRQIL